MDILGVLGRKREIKGAEELTVLAISTDNMVSLTKLRVAETFLVAKGDDFAINAWAITDKLKPFERFNAKNELTAGPMLQVILEDACVPQFTSHEPKYENDSIIKKMKELYNRAMDNVDAEKQKSLSLRTIQLSIAGVIGIFIVAMILA